MAELLVSLGAKGVRLVAPADASFPDLCNSYTGVKESANPSAVALPDSAEQVQEIVQECIATGKQIAVRGGGHDMYKRYTKAGAVLIDLRALKNVEVSADKKTATVGAGLTSEQLLAELEPHGLQAVTGTGATVGFAGWSMGGGYGPLDSQYGIGAHQIVGAKIVNGEGKLIAADERLLKAIRGGAAFFGIVVELTVKVYPLDGVSHPVMLSRPSSPLLTSSDNRSNRACSFSSPPTWKRRSPMFSQHTTSWPRMASLTTSAFYQSSCRSPWPGSCSLFPTSGTDLRLMNRAHWQTRLVPSRRDCLALPSRARPC